MAAHLITGGNGYFGTILSHYLLKKGEIVRVLDINPPKEKREGIEYIQGDICDKRVFEQALKGIDYVHHNAVYIPFFAKKNKILDVNINGLNNILELSVKNGVKKIIIVSSSTVYGNQVEGPITARTPLKPNDFYGEVRKQAEELAFSFVSKGLECVILRPHLIADFSRKGIFELYFNKIQQNRTIWVPRSVAYIHQFIHALDLAKACFLAMGYKGSKIFNLGADSTMTLEDMLLDFIKRTGSSSKIKYVPQFLITVNNIMDDLLGISFLGSHRMLTAGKGFIFETSSAKEELGWAPDYNDLDIWQEMVKSCQLITER